MVTFSHIIKCMIVKSIFVTFQEEDNDVAPEASGDAGQFQFSPAADTPQGGFSF